jgi:hypothetical protein
MLQTYGEFSMNAPCVSYAQIMRDTALSAADGITIYQLRSHHLSSLRVDCYSLGRSFCEHLHRLGASLHTSA